MKRFKKVYIEITNNCNLNCSFCIGNTRVRKFMCFDDFKLILSKIRDFTDYIYLHILGEPLIHPDVNRFIDYAYSMGFNVNVTTNGYFINLLRSHVRQINISLHSYQGSDLLGYLDNVFSYVDNLTDTFVSLRLWVKNNNYDSIISFISSRYGISVPNDFDNFQIKKNVFLNCFHEFIWPDLNNSYYSEEGRCMGLIDHIGILVDGSVVPCCLDSGGVISLGNIFIEDLSIILNTRMVSSMIQGFKCGKKVHELCRHCSFLDEKKKN